MVRSGATIANDDVTVPNESHHLTAHPTTSTVTPTLVPQSSHNNLPATSRTLPAAFFLLGIGSLLPFNALLSVLDYYQLLFPALSISQYITNAYTLPFMLIGILATALPPPPRLRAACILISYTFMFTVSLLFPLLTTRPTAFQTAAAALASRQLISILALSVILGLANVLDQSVLYGLIGLFPDTACTTYFNTGSAFASILLVVLRIFTRILLDDPTSTSPPSLRPGFNLFFAVCTLVCLACIFVFRWMYTRSSSFATHVRAVWEAKSSPQPTDVDHPLPPTPSLFDRLRTARDTLRDIVMPVLCQFLCFVVTLLLFPSIMAVIPIPLRATASTAWASWYPLVVVAAFALGDTMGRSLLSGKVAVIYPSALPILTALRIVLSPLVPLMWVGIIPSSWLLTFLAVFLHGYINGFLMNMAFIIAPMQTDDVRREAAGRFVFIALNVGLFVGTASAWVLQTILRNAFSF